MALILAIRFNMNGHSNRGGWQLYIESDRKFELEVNTIDLARLE